MEAALDSLNSELRVLQQKAQGADQVLQENESLREKLRQITLSFTQLVEDNHRKQARIDALEKRLKASLIKSREIQQCHALSLDAHRPRNPSYQKDKHTLEQKNVRSVTGSGLTRSRSFLLPQKRSTASREHGTSRKPPSFLPPKPRVAPGPEDSEPLRARPLHRLSIQNFRLNPRWNGSTDFTALRNDQDRSVFKALALTSSTAQKSDDELLKDFLGARSHDTVQKLTPVARANLLADARTNEVAKLYGKYPRERPQSPPGFWRTEMPGSQEALDDRKQAEAIEREEVTRRYLQAMTGSGKWAFTDE